MTPSVTKEGGKRERLGEDESDRRVRGEKEGKGEGGKEQEKMGSKEER